MDEAGFASEVQDATDKVAALLNPRNVVIVGATDRPGNWTVRVRRNLLRYGFKGTVYPFNPGRDTVWENEKCYRAWDELPEAPDHLVVLVPAKAVPGVLREAAAAGARSATVMTSGFDEAGDKSGRSAGAELRAAIRETGLAVSGPNCLGNFAAANTFVTMPDDRPQPLVRGPIAVIGQSGGLATAVKRTLEDRGNSVGYVVTSGNEAGLTTADYIRYFTQDSDTKVIVSYLEAVHDRDNFLDACRAARDAGKPVVLAKLGTSNEGRAAALAHTGSLAGTVAAFDAVAGAAGAIRVTTLDDIVEVVELLLHTKLPGAGGGLGAITFSGGLRGLLLDAASRNGMAFAPLAPKTRKAMEKFLGAGSIVGNPLDGGYATLSTADAYPRCIELMLADPNIDVLLLQEELLREPGNERKERNLRAAEEFARAAGKPIVYVSMISYALTDYSRELRTKLPHLPFLHEADKAVRAVKSVCDYAGKLENRTPAKPRLSTAAREVAARIREMARAAKEPAALSEVDSKALLAAYGFPVPREHLATSAAGAAKAAAEIGFPVVLKGVSADLPHKTEAGAVLVGLDSAKAVREGFETILRNVKRRARGVTLDGVLVAEMATGGLELALGIHNDPEVGPVVMFGSGGTALELHGDVAFAAPELDAKSAAALVGRTRAARLLNGWRGQAAYDRKAVEKALVALGALARDLGDVIESVDVNPFVAFPGTKGAMALDALVVVKSAPSPGFG